MINQNDKLERFAEVINKNAQKKCKKIEKEAAALHKKQIATLEKDIAERSRNVFSYEVTRLQTQTNREISALQRESQLKLNERREQITAEVFEKARRQLADFTKTPEYDAYLAKSIEQLLQAIDGKVTVYVRAQDKQKAEKITADLDCGAVVEVSDGIELGGAAAENESKTVFADNTIEQRLEMQKEVFMAQSGLSVCE